MRWLALVALTLNGLLWYVAYDLGASGTFPVAASGTLPRVESLKASGGVGEAEPEAGVPEAAVAPSVPDIAPEKVCVEVGWLESRENATAVARPISGRGLPFAMIESEREQAPLHWVIIPPQPRDVALRQYRSLQRKGIDSYLVTRGENRNAISLGLFESREAAISVLEEKKRQNLNAILAKFPRNQISYALSFEAGPDLAKELVQAVKTVHGGKFDFVEINPCQGVATPEKNP